MAEGNQLAACLEEVFNGNMPFEELQARIMEFQFRNNPVMRSFESALGFRPPFIPIRFFKEHQMLCQGACPGITFRSSGTTGQVPSCHFVHDPAIYQKVCRHGFEAIYGRQPRIIFALLPHYLERGDSSLVFMVKDLMDQYGLPGSGFYLNNHAALAQAILEHGEAGEPVLLIGVAYALLDFAEQFPGILPPGSIVMETGGMKGRRTEVTRSDLHAALMQAWGLDAIHSEYGMTELLSQAYAVSDGRYHPAVTMRASIMDPYEPGRMLPAGSRGRLCITDLANIWSCAFIMTDDLGLVHADGTFEVFGRIETAEVRGCSLLYTG